MMRRNKKNKMMWINIVKGFRLMLEHEKELKNKPYKNLKILVIHLSIILGPILINSKWNSMIRNLMNWQENGTTTWIKKNHHQEEVKEENIKVKIGEDCIQMHLRMNRNPFQVMKMIRHNLLSGREYKTLKSCLSKSK